MNCWRALPDLLEDEDLVLVTVAQTRGSVPREAGTSMLVSMTRTVGTIGGGHLEWEAMAHARAMLLAAAAPALQRLSLGARLGQCCGGVVWLVFERIARSEREVWLERSNMIERSTIRRELDSTGSSQWTICSPDEAQRNPGACLQTYHSPSPGSVEPPSPRGEGTATSTPEGSSPLSLGGEARVSRGMPRAREADWQCSASRGAQSGVPRQGRERGNGANSDTPISEASTWHFTQTITPQKFNITVFGAGHVGAAIVQVLATLEDTQIRWIDVRDDLFGNPAPNVTCITTDTPEEEVDHAPPDTFFLVLTHSHALDLELTARILKRDAFAWFGLIGSRTKRARFEHRLHAQGIPSAQLSRMVCPIGVAGIASKAPQVIAVAVVAQLLQAKEALDRNPAYMDLAHECP